MKGKLVAVYGSLKKGYYNHEGLGEDSEYLGNMTIDAVMYSNGSYPKIYHQIENPTAEGDTTAFGSDKVRKHEVEVYRINEKRYFAISSMEHGAGYVSEDIETPYGTATMYWMPHKRFSEHDHWVEAYKKEGGAFSHF